jgi:hypothetical protein
MIINQITIDCLQVRIHNCQDCDFYLLVKSNPIIEQCSNIGFAPYAFQYPNQQEQFQAAGFQFDGIAEQTDVDNNSNNSNNSNKWKNVEDFNWLKSGHASPNWHLIPKDQWKKEVAPS